MKRFLILAVLLSGIILIYSQINSITGFFSTTSFALQSSKKVAATSKGLASAANPVLPSVQGFGSDLFTGASTVYYSINIPPGPGGFAPSIGFIYSSGSVDDMRLGEKEWDEKYHRQAGWLGLGWSLAGIGYIVRDNGPNFNMIREATEDDKFYLVFPGGSAEILKKNGEWKTDPELFLKIEHRIPDPNGDYWKNKYVHDTDPWIITTPDGTKYYFGNPVSDDGWLLKWEGGPPFPVNVNINKGDYDKKVFDASLSTAYVVITSYDPNCREDTPTCDEKKASTILPYKWMLRKIVDTHGNTIEFEYETRVKYADNYGDVNGWSSKPCYNNRCPNHYIQTIVPRRIKYSNNHVIIEFEEELRDDYKISNWDKSNFQNFWNRRRLKAINIKVDNQLVRRYVLDYDYVWKDGSDEKGHSLLKSITQYGRDGRTRLPSYEFTYKKEKFNNAVLKTANNGHGGKVTFDYEFTPVRVCDPKKRWGCQIGIFGAWRNRVWRKTIEDGMGNSYQILYEYYGVPKAYVKQQGDQTKGIPFSGFEFLGYERVDEKIYAMNDPSKLERETRNYFYSFKESDNCFKPDPRKGIAYRVEVYNSNGKQLSRTESFYLPDKTCEEISHDDSYFPHLSQTDNFVGNDHSRVHYGPYDDYGNVLRIDFYGDVNKGGDEKTIRQEFHPNTNLWIINLPAKQSVYEGDVLKTETLYFYDHQNSYELPPKDKGEVTKIGKGGAGYPFVYTHFEYDQWGNLVKEWDANTDPKETPTTQTWYDGTYHVYPVRVQNALGYVSSTDYDYVLGLPISITDLNGVTTYYRYDPLGRLKKVIRPGDTENSPSIEHYYYDSTNSNFGEKEPKLIVETKNKLDENKYFTTRTFYNGLGQVVQTHTLNAEVEGVTKVLVNTVKYNSLGHKSVETLTYAIDSASRFTWDGYHSAPKTTYRYDGLGRITEVNDPLGRTTKTFYEGWKTVSIDAENHQKNFYQDAYGRLIKVEEFVGTYPNTNLYSTTIYEYDALDNLVKVIEPKGIVTRIFYDSLGRKISMDDPDLGHWEYRYDNNGNLIWQKDAKGQIITFAYDKLNRLWRKTYPDGTSVYYWYDKPNPDGCSKQTYSVGKRVEMDDLTGRTCYFYDERGRTIKEIKRIGGEEAVTQFTYNSADAIKTITYPDGEVVTKEYDSIGRLKRLTGFNVYLENLQYDVLGNIKRAQFGNQVQTEYSYDVTGRLQQIHTHGQTNLLQLFYVQDKVGNIVQIQNLLDSAKNLWFSYDELNRLTGASGQYQAQYQYDLVGNMLRKVEGDSVLEMLYTDPAHVHAPKVVNGFEYRYDANGNLIEDEKRIIEYDYDNRPVRITMKDTGVVTEFAYDGDGKRVMKRVLSG